MSRKSSPHSPWSWLDAVADLFGTPSRKASGRSRGRRRTLRLEPLESRSLLSATIPGTISGVAFYDPTGSGQLTAGDTRLSGVTVELYRNGGDQQFDNGGGDNTLIGTTTTNTSGQYSFTGLSAGYYFVEQLPATGYVLPSGQNVALVQITNASLSGTTGVVIDSFSATTQTAGAAYPSGTTGTSYSTASEAIGGARDMFVQLTSAHGAVTLGADSTTPDALDFTTGPGAVGTGQVVWQGQATGAYATAPGMLRNPQGLNHLDLTSAGASTGIELTLGADQTGTAKLTVYTDAGDWSSATVAIPSSADGTAQQEVFVPFSSFSVGAGTGASFSNVGAIELTISGAAAMEAQVANVDAIGPTVLTQNFANDAQADLQIVKSASPSPVVAGDQLTYTFTSMNNGPSNATGVYFTDTLPTGLTYVSYTTSQGSATFANGVFTATLGNMADGAQAITTLVVDVDPSLRGTITNTVNITGNQPDPNLANNTYTIVTPVTAEADLEITKTGNPNPVDAGSTLTYTLTVQDLGPSNSTGVTVVDTLPAGVTYSSGATTTQGSVSASGGTITVAVGNLTANGAAATITIPVTVNSTTTGTITNSATVSGVEPDPNMANNTASCTTTVISIPNNPPVTDADLGIVKTYSPSVVYVGSTFSYTLTVTNYGPSADTDVTVTDTLPAGETVLSYYSSQGSVTMSNGTIQGNLGNMADGGKATVTIVVRDTAAAGATLTNTASVTGDATDPNLTNNQSTVETYIVPLPSKRLFLGR